MAWRYEDIRDGEKRVLWIVVAVALIGGIAWLNNRDDTQVHQSNSVSTVQNAASAAPVPILGADLPPCADPEVVRAAQISASVQHGSWSTIREINGPGQIPPIPPPPFRNCHAEGASGNWDYYIYVRDNDIKIRVYATGAWVPGGTVRIGH